MSLNLVRGWFADIADEDDQFAGKWRPYVQTDFAGISGLDIAFDTREDCEWFIRKHLVGQGWTDGPRTQACPTCSAGAGAWCLTPDGRSRITFHDERLKFMHGVGVVSGEHIMVVPDGLPVSIDGAPEVSTRLTDLCNHNFRQVRVGGRVVSMVTPWPDSVPVPNTPYEAYALGTWTTDVFAIRLRSDLTPKEG